MLVRRLVIAFAALIAGPAAWVASAEPAHAGGPTSVLLSNPADGRVAALYHTSSDYSRLVDLVGAYAPLAGDTARPDAVDDLDAYRLTWMIHDMTVWRIDLVYETTDGLWIETKVEPSGSGDIFAREGRWSQLTGRDQASLSAVFRNAGILGASSSTAAEPADPEAEVVPGAATTAGPGAGLLAAGAGLAGLVIGAGGVMLFRRARSVTRRPHAVLTG